MPLRAQSVSLLVLLLSAAFIHPGARAQDAGNPGEAGETGWIIRGQPCADSLDVGETVGSLGGRAWESGSGTDFVAGEDCDPEEALLFQAIPARERTRESRHASFSLSRTSGQPFHSVLRSRGAQAGWDHRLTINDDTLTRFRLGWRGFGWHVVTGDLGETPSAATSAAGEDRPPAMSLWPRRLPRRTLPLGWRPARGSPDAPQAFSPSRPQGLAAGVSQAGWNAYALRTWNPVATGAEPPWHAAWNLRHVAAGASVSLPWTLALHASETRIARAEVDSTSENLLAAGLASPGGGFDVVVARVESDRRDRAGWMIGADIAHELARDAMPAPGATLNLTLRQRDAGWNSAWDPAVGAPESDDASDQPWGAGEIRMAARLPLHESRESGQPRRRERGFLRGEFWRAWNPDAETSRQGARGAFGWRTPPATGFPRARFELTATHRTSRAASGSVSLYRYAEAETRLESLPRWRASAWRAWNREGPLRSGFFLGAEPAWKTARGSVTLSPGLRLEARENGGEDDVDEDWEGTALLGFRWRPGSGWHLDASASLPCWPPSGLRDAAGWNEARWRMTVTTGR